MGDRCKYAHIQPETSLHSLHNQTSRHCPNRSSLTLSHDLNTHHNHYSKNSNQRWKDPHSSCAQLLCPNVNYQGQCKLLKRGDSCRYLHYQMCDLCHSSVLHPTNRIQREEHRQLCVERQEAKREEELAIERSREKTCGVCLEVVWNKENDQRFGLLENCDHVFCLQCIRTWRSLSNYEHQVVKACPECRTKSFFVTPTKYWPKDSEAKEKFIQNYKQTLQKIHCKHFRRGDGRCPFGSKCFYLHVDKDGKPVQLEPPQRRRYRSRIDFQDSLDDLSDIFMMSLISQAQVDGFLSGWDFLFLDGDDDDDDDDDDVLYHSYYTDEADLTDNDEDFSLWN